MNASLLSDKASILGQALPTPATAVSPFFQSQCFYIGAHVELERLSVMTMEPIGLLKLELIPVTLLGS